MADSRSDTNRHHGEKLKNLEPALRDRIKKDHPDYADDQVIEFQMLISYRLDYLESMIGADSTTYSALNKEVIESIRAKDSITEGTLTYDATKLTVGQKAADTLANIGGSWPFILVFVCILIAWILLNTFALLGKNFDPYPFILLNLVLSCLAAIQAPIIMMSQNRQSERDRQREVNDYKVNLKAEIEIKLLHEKMDYLIEKPWSHLLDLQRMQVELVQRIEQTVDELKQASNKDISGSVSEFKK